MMAIRQAMGEPFFIEIIALVTWSIRGVKMIGFSKAYNPVRWTFKKEIHLVFHTSKGKTNNNLSWWLIRFTYSLRPIILFANVDVSRHILVVDTSVLPKSNMGQRE
jgi:hypothetical protein